VYDVVALNSPFKIGRFIAYTHVSKTATTSDAKPRVLQMDSRVAKKWA
jgi:hypothetical protein